MKLETSIIAPLYNQVEYTKKCVESILADSKRPPLELILVDNASTDGTREYLDQVMSETRHLKDLRWVRIQNEKNLGVAPAWNQGLKAASTDELYVINNDILTPSGWIQKTREGWKRHDLALACPYAINGKLDYDLEKYAQKFTERNSGEVWDDYSFCAFFMPRSTLNEVGFFDEKFLIGGYEDTDYCYRLAAKGLKFGVIGSAFIHHFGSITLGEFKKGGDKHGSHNRNYFIQKWGEDPSLKNRDPLIKLRTKIRKLKMKMDWM